MISDDEIVLADCNNNSIRILNVRENKITSTYIHDAYPWDVTEIKPGKIAATIPSFGKILIMNTIGGLSVSHSLKVSGNCLGIDHKNDIIAVSLRCPYAVQILNMEGGVLHETNYTNLFSFPGHITLNIDNKSVYVSDRKKNAVYELAFDGKVIRTMKHKNLRSPRGLAVFSDGTIAVSCDGVSDMVSIILPNTREIRSLSVEHVKRPVSLLVCEEQNTLFLSDHWDSVDGNKIIVFDFR